jgi:hypothetical protein
MCEAIFAEVAQAAVVAGSMLCAVVHIDLDFAADHCISARSGLCGVALRLPKGGAEPATTCCIVGLMLKSLASSKMKESLGGRVRDNHVDRAASLHETKFLGCDWLLETNSYCPVS